MVLAQADSAGAAGYKGSTSTVCGTTLCLSTDRMNGSTRCDSCERSRIMTALLCQTRRSCTLSRGLITAALLSPACCRYAVDQLTWLVAETSNTAAPAYLANLQQRIEECDRAGSRNSSLPAGENLGSFADRVGRAGSAADVQTAVSHIP